MTATCPQPGDSGSSPEPSLAGGCSRSPPSTIPSAQGPSSSWGFSCALWTHEITQLGRHGGAHLAAGSGKGFGPEGKRVSRVCRNPKRPQGTHENGRRHELTASPGRAEGRGGSEEVPSAAKRGFSKHKQFGKQRAGARAKNTRRQVKRIKGARKK